MTTLYHYTCEHGHAGIGDQGQLLSAAIQLEQRRHMDQLARMSYWERFNADLIWLTDLDYPIRQALGLTMHTIACDRIRHRYRVVDYNAMHYPTVRRDLPKQVRDLERAPGAMPMHWWIAYTPVPVVYDPITVGAA